jgi:DNA-binding XRE family transcriptional regulator
VTKEQLKQWRMKNGHTQGTLATALGVHPIAVARWEIGTRKIPSFLYLALRCLELEGGEPMERDRRKKKTKKESD